MKQKYKAPSLVAGEKFKSLLKERGFTYESFAYDFGIQPRQVSRWIHNGISKIDIIYQIAEFFDVDKTSLLL